MKPKKKKTSAIAQAIEEAVFANVNTNDVSDDDNTETRAKVSEKVLEDFENDDDLDIFTKDFSSEQKPSKLRIQNSAKLDSDKRYKGKKVSRKSLQAFNDDLEEIDDNEDDLEKIENNSSDSEDEAMGEKEHENAELGHMFFMEGVEYDDTEEENRYLKKNKKKGYRSQSPDFQSLEDDFENDEFQEVSGEEESDDEMSQKIKALMNDEKTRENESDMSNEDSEEEEQDSDEKDQESDQSEQDSDQNSEESDSALKSDQENESESENEMKAFQNQLKKASKSKKDLVKDDSERDSDSENENQMKDLDIYEADSDENMSENGDFSENDSESEDDFDNEMGPDLSEMLKNDESSDDENAENEESDAKLFSDKNVQKEVEKGKSIKNQLQIWDSLLELRISLQKSLSKINQFPLDLKPFKENKEKSDEEENELKQSQVNLAKVLDQLLDLKKSMLSKNKVFSRPDEPLGKKRKLNDYEKYLDTGFDSMKSWRNETMEDWNDRTRIVGSKNGFSGFETSVTRQIEHILADKPRLVKRTKMKRTIYDVIGQEATGNFIFFIFYRKCMVD